MMIDALFQKGCRAMASGEYKEAIRIFREALTHNPLVPDIWNNLGIALFNEGDRGDAIEAFRRAVEMAPGFAEAHNNLGRALAECGRLEEALDICSEAVILNPAYAEGHNTLGTILTKIDRHRQALRHFARACALAPGYALAWLNKGNAEKELGWYQAAAKSFRKILDIDPCSGTAMQSIAGLYQQRGFSDRALLLFRKAVELSPDDPHIHSNLIMAMGYSPLCTQKDIGDESKLWGERHGSYPIALTPAERKPVGGRRICVGYVSPDFHHHPVGIFLKQVLKNHDKAAFEITCYQNGTRSDETTAELRRYADRWFVIAGMSDEETASFITSNGIDILVDLSGHTGYNRLTLFARKPAPIQVSWLGYCYTTGLGTMDYLITDSVTSPLGEDRYYTEQLVRLPQGRLCYSPPAPSPFVDELPASANGFVTFGSFNNIAKLSPNVISLWARVLLAVPGSRLILKWKSFERVSVRKRFISEFASFGIDAGRIEFRGSTSHFLNLVEYNDIDIALDTFPYNGGLTSCEAMWMGVPVITLAGATPIGRQTTSFLTAIKMTELIAVDEGRYVDIAASLAGDITGLARLREGLRERMESSPLCNGVDFTRKLEEEYRTMVREKSANTT